MTTLSASGALGTLCIMASLGFAIFGLVTSALGGARHDARLAETGRRAAIGVFVFVLAAVAVLEYALLTTDTSIRYVATHSAISSPLWVKIVSLWGALEGSILLWAFLLAAYTLAASRVARNDALRPYALATLYGVLIFFLGVNASIGSPFTPVPNPPADGLGPNALLQNHWMMAVHPMLMYLGFVGLSVPFAYAMSAMLTGRLGEAWLVQTRRWTLVAWAFLSAAIVAGGWWSYEVLGWGGYWAWDPVENASIIPWFLATAFLHSLQIQERRRILKGWNLGLIVAAFSATLFGTFITRSGIVESVHAFASGPIGPVFLGFLAFVLLVSLGVAWVRLPLIRDDQALDSPISREGAFLAGNVLFSAFAFTVVLGTLFPVIVEAFTGQKASVGAPFFNQVAVPLGLAILVLQGTGPALTWRRVSGEALWRTLRWPAAAGVTALVVFAVLGIHRPAVLLTVMCAVYTFSVLVVLTSRAVSQRAASGGGRPWVAFGELVNLYPRRYGAYIAHMGVVVVALGIAFSGGYKQNQEVSFRPAQTRTVLGYTVTYLLLTSEHRPEKDTVGALVRLGGREFVPKLNFYGTDRQPIPTPAIRYTPLGDTYLSLVSFDRADQSIVLNVISSPLVSWIWLGGLIVVLGAALSLTPAVVAQSVRQAAPATKELAGD